MFSRKQFEREAWVRKAIMKLCLPFFDEPDLFVDKRPDLQFPGYWFVAIEWKRWQLNCRLRGLPYAAIELWSDEKPMDDKDAYGRLVASWSDDEPQPSIHLPRLMPPYWQEQNTLAETTPL